MSASLSWRGFLFSQRPNSADGEYRPVPPLRHAKHAAPNPSNLLQSSPRRTLPSYQPCNPLRDVDPIFQGAQGLAGHANPAGMA